MPAEERLQQRLREVGLERREEEKRLVSRVAEREKDARDLEHGEDEILRAAHEERLRLEAEFKEALRRVDVESRERVGSLRARVEQTRRDIDGLRAEQAALRGKFEAGLRSLLLESLRTDERTLEQRERLLREGQETRRRREALLASRAELASLHAEYESLRHQLELLPQGLPKEERTAIEAIFRDSLAKRRWELEKAGIPLDEGTLPPSEEVLVLFDLEQRSEGDRLVALVPCPYSECSQVTQGTPTPGFRLAASVVRAAAELQRSLTGEADPPPIQHDEADGHTRITAVLPPGGVLDESADLFSLELEDSAANTDAWRQTRIVVRAVRVPSTRLTATPLEDRIPVPATLDAVA